ncbi:leukocyte elastase inhibitor [Halyomorpha halys]|uniref:leukocyte elastase inhibitor n=1 Tax=Halyomorpha halys TaxID=286706 RepID=UPI0006D4E22A|nr:leukocyte elastase inhibitor [Halyomorpha halys]
MRLTCLFISLLYNFCQAQRFGLSNVVSLTNGIIPNILHALSFDYDNVVYSPFGLSTSLAIVFEGVGTKLAEDMIKTLKLDNPNPSVAKQVLRTGFKSLLEEFEKEKHAQDVAGSYNDAHLYSTTKLVPDYQSVLENFYKVSIVHNSTSTNSSEEELQLEIHTDTGVMSHWKDFDKLAVYTYLTHHPSAPFLSEKGVTIEVPMIPQVGTYRAGYIKRLKSQAVELHLETKRATLFLLMPDERIKIRDVLEKMLKENIGSLPASLPLIETEVAFPQFVILNNNLDLSKTLQQLGLKDIFETKSGPVKSIKQNAYFATSFVSVNSVGSTNTVLYKKMPKREKRQIQNTLVFNKPFIFFLLHKPTGIVLLAGLVRSPSQVP